MEKKQSLIERFQKLAGIKPLYELDDQMDQELDDITKSRVDFYPEDKPDDKLPIPGEGEIEISLEDLNFNYIVDAFTDNYQDVHFPRKQPKGDEGNYYRDGINFPNFDDSSTHIGDENAWEDWKNKTMRHYGNVEIVLNSEGKNWFDKVFISDDQFNDDRDKFIRGKMSAMQRDQELGRSID